MTDWETVRTLDTEEEAALLVGLLEEDGIHVAVESQIFHLGAAAYGQLGQVHVRVPAEEAGRARALLAERADEALAHPEESAGDPPADGSSG